MRFNVRFNEQNMQIGVKFANLQRVTEYNDADPYTGSYVVTPKVDAQRLPTAKKLMADDVQIKAIPIYEVSNNSDGETVYIGTEVEIYGD